MTDVTLSLSIEDERWLNDLPDVAAMAEKTKNAAFAYVAKEQKTILNSLKKHAVVNVCLSNDEAVQRLNHYFRGIDKPTNVLSFANIDFADFAAIDAYFKETDLGNIILAYETLCREAVAQEITFSAHFNHLLVHGFLHILGYDHMTEDEALQMEGLEIKILAQLGTDNPYEDNNE